MMYSLKEQHPSLCVLRVSTDVLDLPGVVVTDRNAASDYVRFGPAPAALALVDRELVFARYWTHGDLIEAWRRKSIKCAEVLVPDRVDAMHVSGAYVSSRASREALIRVAPRMPIAERPDLFFR
jgi:hypothetical protein